MPRINLYFPKRVKDKMKMHPNVNWPNAMRSIIEQKLDELESK